MPKQDVPGEPLKAAVVIDSWKLKIFKEHLDAKGYEYTQHPGITHGTLILKVVTTNMIILADVIKAAQDACWASRGGKP